MLSRVTRGVFHWLDQREIRPFLYGGHFWKILGRR